MLWSAGLGPESPVGPSWPLPWVSAAPSIWLLHPMAWGDPGGSELMSLFGWGWGLLSICPPGARSFLLKSLASACPWALGPWAVTSAPLTLSSLGSHLLPGHTRRELCWSHGPHSPWGPGWLLAADGSLGLILSSVQGGRLVAGTLAQYGTDRLHPQQLRGPLRLHPG